MLAKLKKIQTKKLSNAPHTLCELYCYNRCSQTLQHSEKHHSLAMYTYIQPSLQTYKARGNMGSQTQNDIQEKKKNVSNTSRLTSAENFSSESKQLLRCPTEKSLIGVCISFWG